MSGILFVWRRVERVWQAAVEMPRDKQVLAFRPYVGKSTPQLIHDSLVVADGEESPGTEKKSRDESRLSRLDSLRHRLSEQYCNCLIQPQPMDILTPDSCLLV